METKINSTQTQESIWTQENLVAGDDLAIQLLPQPLIDSHTNRLFHLNGDWIDSITGDDCATTDIHPSWIDAKFNKGFTTTNNSKYNFIIPTYYNTETTSFTIDFWVKRLASGTTRKGFCFLKDGTDYRWVYFSPSYFTLGKWICGTNGYYDEKSYDYPDGINPTNNITHFCYCYNLSNKTVYVFLDGKLVDSFVISYTSSTIQFGLFSIDTEFLIDEVRYSNVCRYTSDFTPFEQPYSTGGSDVYKIQPTNLINTQQLTSALSVKQDKATSWNKTNLTAGRNIAFQTEPSPIIDDNTILLSHFDTYPTAFINIITGNSFTLSGSSFESNRHKFGTGCAQAPYTSGTYDCFSLPKRFEANDDFTIDFWFFKGYSSGQNENCCFKYDVGSGSNLYRGFTFIIQNNTVKASLKKVNNTDPDIILNCNSGWNHIAYERIGSTGALNMYLNGKLVHTQTYALAFTSCWWNDNNYRGYIDELRVSDIARYNGQDFTPFNQPYSNDNPALYKVNSTLVAGTGIDITGNVISATGSSSVNLVAGDNITITEESDSDGEQTVISAPDVYKRTNLLAGNNIQLVANGTANYIVLQTEGTLTVENWVASNFYSNNNASTVRGITGPDLSNISFSSFEIGVKINTGEMNTYSTYPVFARSVYDTSKFVPCFYTLSDNTIVFQAVDNNNEWHSISVSNSSNILLNNTIYWIKAIWDGTYLKLYKSSNGTDYTQIGSDTECSSIKWDTALAIGYDARYTSAYFNGSIYLEDLYININGQRYWDAVTHTSTNINLDLTQVSGYSSSGTKVLETINGTLTWAEQSGGSGSAPTTVWFKNNTGTTLNTELTLSDTTEVYKNGILLEPSVLDSDSDLESDEEINDYTISGSSIIFTDALVSTDKITVKVY